MRKYVVRTAALIAALFVSPSILRTAASADEPNSSVALNLGEDRELFVDDHLIEKLTDAELVLHKPEPQEVVLVCDKPWEGNTSAYYTIFQDGDLLRAYYRGAHFDTETKKAAHPEVTCYAESRDGIHWSKPELVLIEFNGSTKNNIIWDGAGTHNFTAFLDDNPDAPAEARYKALAGGTVDINGKKKACLNALTSPDGLHWTQTAVAVITDGAFDSQNLAFYDVRRGEYRAYWRYFSRRYTDEQGKQQGGHRAIRTAVSKDFLHWENQADLQYEDSPDEHLYTNAIRKYFRAPQLFVGFPTRFQAKTQQVEPVFMTSRDGVLFRRWAEELIPITAPADRDGNRSNYMTSALVQTPGNPRELSVYATEAYYEGPGSRVRRFTYRTDGFVSVHAESGSLLTRPLIVSGDHLKLNVAARGECRVEVADADGKPVPGFTAGDCSPICADELDVAVRWGTKPLASLRGQTVRLRFVLKDTDLYAMRFGS